MRQIFDRQKVSFGSWIMGAFMFLGVCVGSQAADQPIPSAPKWYSESRDLYYGLPVQIRFYPANPKLSQKVWDYLFQVDDVFNDFKVGSAISRINAMNAAESVTLSPLLFEAFQKAEQAFEISEGAFDISCAPLRNLWRKAAREGRMPAPKEVADVKARCGLELTRLEDNRLVLKKAGLEFDFGGIIKGIIADRVTTLLKQGGAESALVQIGRETAAFGLSPKNRPYRIAVQHPGKRYGAWCVVHNPGLDFSGSTSGNYENPLVIDGKEFYHIVDPRTGYPAGTNILSVSIVFPKTGMNWLADALSTTGVLLGPDKTIEIVQEFGGAALFLLEGDEGIIEVKSQDWERFEL